MKKLRITLSLALVGVSFLAAGSLRAQEDLKALIYGSDTAATGTAPGTASGILGAVTVNQVYVGSSYTYSFVTDASGVSGYIYNASTTPVFTANTTYTGLDLTSAPYSSGTPAATNLELTIASANTVTTGTANAGSPMFSPVAEGSLTGTSTITANYTTPSTTVPGNLEPVQFTFTPSTSAAATTSATLTDANGDSIVFYRATTPVNFVANQPVTIDGFAFGYKSGVEIAYFTAVVPEPSSYVLMGLGGFGLMLFARRSKLA